MEVKELKARIGQGGFCYLFTGDEDYLKRFYVKELAKGLFDESMASFLETRFDGADIDLPALADAVRTPPFMGENKLVVWKYADFTKMDVKTKKDLCALLENRDEYPFTTLVFLTTSDGFPAGNLPKMKSKLYKEFENLLDIVVFDTPKDTEILGWLKRHFDAEKVTVTPNLLRLLLDRCGNSMDVLSNEVAKLCYYVKENNRNALTEEDVEKVATPTEACDAFALSNAILSADKTLALRALAERRAARDDPSLVLGMLTRIYTDLCAVCSLLAEGVNTDDCAKVLNMNAYKAKLYASAGRKLGKARLDAAVFALCGIDADMKFGARDGYAALDMFIVEYV